MAQAAPALLQMDKEVDEVPNAAHETLDPVGVGLSPTK